jgi:arylsulfatase A-like enzyme
VSAPGRRAAGALVAAAAALAAAAAWPAAVSPPDPRPNVIVVLTDDQPWDTLEAMPWLSSELARPGSGWTSFPLAFANTPLCCPSRATLLTGRLPRHTGVLRNEDAAELDEARTLATRLHDAGYRTAIVGKYLNRYPFGRIPYVPPGWDRAVIKRNASDDTVYRDFDAVEQGSPVHVVDAYATEWLADRAVSFLRSSPRERPLFLLFAPSAPHAPWVPADRHRGAAADVVLEEAPTVVGALRGAPPWVEARPLPSAAQRAEWLDERRRMLETLRAVDDAVRGLVGALGDRLDDTVILVLSDHGYSFGEHRWAGKKCPYEACVRIPLLAHVPRGVAAPAGGPVAIVDLMPTILDLAGVPSPGRLDGTSFAGRLGARGAPGGDRAAFLEWAGDAEIPSWEAVRTSQLKLIRYEDGTEELYDLGGVLGPADPFEADNRVRDPAYAEVLADLRRLLGRHPGRR